MRSITMHRQECEATLKHKTDLLGKLESQKDTMTAAIAQLEQKYADFIDFCLLFRFVLY